MSDPKIRIPIEIPAGDMSGAEEADFNIKKLIAELAVAEGGSDALTESFARADAAIADLEGAVDALDSVGESAEAADDGVNKLFDQQRMQGIGKQFKGLAQAAGNFAREFSESDAAEEMFSGLSEEVKVFGETAIGIASGVAAGYAEGGPIGAAIGGLTQLVDTLSGGWLEMNNRVKAAEAELEAAILANNARIRDRKREAASREIEGTYKAEREELELQRQELERISKLRDSERALAKAKDALSDTKALAAGTPQAKIDIENVGQDFAANQEELQEKIRVARQQLELDAADMLNAAEAYSERAKLVGTDLAKGSDELKAYEAAVKNVAKGERDLAALDEKLNLQAQTFQAEAETKLEQQKARLLDSLGTSAEALEAELQAGIEKAGGNASTAARSALLDVQRLLEDGAIKEDEVNALLSATQRLQGSIEARDRKTAEAIKQIASNGEIYSQNLNEALSLIRTQGNQLDQQARDIRELRRQIASAP